MSTQKLMRAIRALGWSVEVGRGGHLVCRHPDAGRSVYCSGTPSASRRGWITMQTQLRRALRTPRPTYA